MARRKRVQYKVYDTIANLTTGSVNAVVVRKISWYGDDPKIDIRRWFNYNNANEAPGHGVTLGLEAADTLVEELIRNGYGRREELEKILDNRTEIDREEVTDEEEVSELVDGSVEEKKVKTTDEYYSAKDLLALSYDV